MIHMQHPSPAFVGSRLFARHMQQTAQMLGQVEAGRPVLWTQEQQLQAYRTSAVCNQSSSKRRPYQEGCLTGGLSQLLLPHLFTPGSRAPQNPTGPTSAPKVTAYEAQYAPLALHW